MRSKQEIEGELQSHTKKMQRIETELNGFVVSATDAKSKTIGEVLAETKQDVLRLESDIKQISKKVPWMQRALILSKLTLCFTFLLIYHDDSD